MPRIKVARKSTAIDMTAMCDVAFLLLTFFILTATSRQPEPLPVQTPASTVQIKVPDKNIAMLTVGQGKVFMEMTERQIKRRALEIIGKQYSIPFSEDEKKRFEVMSSFGVPVSNLKQLIGLAGDQRNKAGVQKGIPTDSTDNQLKQWLLAARTATKELNNESMRISIKGDSKEEYPTIKKVIAILQDQKINKFSLLTSAKSLKDSQ